MRVGRPEYRYYVAADTTNDDVVSDGVPLVLPSAAAAKDQGIPLPWSGRERERETTRREMAIVTAAHEYIHYDFRSVTVVIY